MEVILREDVDNLGHRGELVKVAPGYARNFLLPNKLALEATKANLKIVEQVREAAIRKSAKEVGDAQELAKLMSGLTLTIKAKAGENDQLFGSIGSQDIARALEGQKFTIERRKIQLPEPIKTLGDHTVAIKLHRDVTTDVTVSVVKDE
jgi:large subunit ribosomal protein L9